MKRGAATRARLEIGQSSNHAESSVSGNTKRAFKISQDGGGANVDSNCNSQSVVQRRILRSQYNALRASISEEKENLIKVGSDKFDHLINKAESLHALVQRPREQVADAETLLNLTETLATTVKRSRSGDITSPNDFINAMLGSYKDGSHGRTLEESTICIEWGKIGQSASSVFEDAAGLSTVLGPLDIEPKQRKATLQKKRSKPVESTKPETIKDANAVEQSETDKNMAVMFGILKKHKQAILENLVLNRISFSQTVENIFSLSFLVKDGRVEINVDENGNHIVVPKNSPSTNELASGEASYNQFVFRFDFSDWKLMKEFVEDGKELMPHRTNNFQSSCSNTLQGIVSEPSNSVAETQPETPIRKLTRNRGRVLNQVSVTDGNIENSCSEDAEDFEKPLAKRRSRRLL